MFGSQSICDSSLSKKCLGVDKFVIGLGARNIRV